MASTDQGGQTGALDAIVDAALAARDAGRTEEGVTAITAALARHPRDARLWQVLGLLHRAMENSAAAAEALGKAAQLAPADARIAHAHARVTMEAGFPALALFERARRLAPLDGDLLTSRAAAQLAEGQGAAAMAEIDALLKASPTWLQGQELLANMRWMLGERDRFTAGYERAIAADPANLSLWLALAARLMHADDYAALDMMLARARGAAGPHMAFDANEAICASELGDIARADRLFERLAAVPDDGFAVRHVRHLLRAGRIEAAARRAEPLVHGAEAGLAWPYLSVAWRLLDDERWQWLEGDPGLVGSYDIMDPADITPLAERLRTLHTTHSHPIGQSVRGGTQTDGPLFAREEREIRALRAAIVEAVSHHIGRIGPQEDAHPTLRHVGKRFRFAGSWSVRLSGSGHHSNHIHQQGWISSAFYVSIPPQAEMGAEPAGWLQLGAPPPELGLDLAPCRIIEPKAGRLVLFPSTMWHGTLPIEAGERLTVAFDVAAIG